MELIYLWIDSYKNIRQKGFNFSAEYYINYEGNKLLTIEKKQDQLVDIFNSSFLNVTAIIGVNGSGKTNLLEFIEYFFIHGTGRYIHYNSLLILKNRKGKLIIYNGDHYSKGSLKIISDEIPFEEKSITNWQDFNEIQENIKPVYFSGGIEIENNPRFVSSYIEATGGDLLKRMIKKTNEELLENFRRITESYENSKKDENAIKTFDENKSRLIQLTTPFYHFLNNELQTKINFISNHSLKDYDFIPFSMDLSFNEYLFYDIGKSFPTLNEFELTKELDNLLSINEFSDFPESEKAKSYLRDGLLISIFLFLLNYSKTNTFIKFDIEDLILKFIAEDGITKKANVIKEAIDTANLINSGWYFNREALQDIVRNIDIYIKEISVVPTHSRKISVKIDEALGTLFRRLFSFWNINEFILTFDWIQMSAGQNAILTLFSRLFQLGTVQNLNPEDTIWFFIDEGEVYIHPEWQRRFFNDLHEFLPKFYPKNKIQLIISTHSPYVASDIPKNNIIMLKRAKNTACEIVDMATIPETFGANIHELLAHSFFMENGTIGEFAKDIINDLFNYLTEKKTIRKWDEITVKNTIQIVGEPIIKDQLLMLYDLKFKTKSEAEYLLSQKERIDARLKELGQNDKNTAE